MSRLTRAVIATACVAGTVLVTAPAAFAAAPAAVTGSASSVTATTASLAGTVNPGTENTTYTFEYGTTTSYGSSTPTGTINGAATPTTITRGSVSGTDYVKTEAAAVTSVAVTKPTADGAGKLLVADVTNGGGTMTLPTGWAWATGMPFTTTGVGKGLAWHVGSGSDPASWTFSQGTSDKLTVIVTVYSGVDTTTPFDGTPTKATSLASSVVVPSLTTTVAGARLITGGAANCSTSCTITKPSTSTLLVGSAGTGKRAGFADETQAAAGATGTRTWTNSVSNLQLAAYLAALKPAPGTGGINTPQAVSANLTGLTGSTLYHYRLKATNSSGTSTGSDATFTTSAPPPPPVPTSPSGPSTSGSWSTAFSDGFDGAALDTTKWMNEVGRNIHGSGILAASSNVEVKNGALYLKLAQDPSTGTYTGGFVGTDADWQAPTAGRYNMAVGDVVQARIYQPGSVETGTGSEYCFNWGGLWTSGRSWPQGGEDDVAECLTTVTGTTSRWTQNYHGITSYSPLNTAQYDSNGSQSNSQTGWHVFTLSRNADGNSYFYIDGVLQRSVTYTNHETPNSAQVLNLAQGKSGSRTGVTGDAGALQVDYVVAFNSSGGVTG